MTIKRNFALFSHPGEQRLLQSLTTEVIQATGLDMYYLPRRRRNFDEIYGADDMSTFDAAYGFEFYVESFAGFSGDQAFMSKFGVEIRDQIFFSCSRERFFEEITTVEPEMIRPREGDLIFFPLQATLFEIKYVDNKPDFYPLGHLPQFRMTCEKFEYNSEKFVTGVPEIDLLYGDTMDVFEHAYLDESGAPLLDQANRVLEVEDFDTETFDPLADNTHVQNSAQLFVDFTEDNPFGDIPEEDQ